MTDRYELIIGNKAYSSWSLRGWLLLDAFGLPFEERVAPLYTEAFAAFQNGPGLSRQVPTLIHHVDGAQREIWDSLAIAEYLAERHPEAGHWPADPAARARARCVAAEMHSGFGALRKFRPMNMKKRHPGRGLGPGVAADIARIDALWRATRDAFGAGGPYLFGAAFTAADAFYAPVASRFETYGAEGLSSAGQEYMAALLAHPAVARWRAGAEAETWAEPVYNQFEV